MIMKKRRIDIEDLLNFLKPYLIKTEGPTDSIYIDNIPDPNNVSNTSLDWINPRKEDKQSIAESSIAKILLVDESIRYSKILSANNKTLLYVYNPRNILALIVENFFTNKHIPGIHPSAIIDEDAIINSSAYIGPGCVVGKAKIGADTVLTANVVIYDDVTIGQNCLIQAGVVIGTDGLGCSRDTEGKLTKFPHIGGVIIGNDVEIGANSQIAKGSLSDTIIENGCKLNGLCYVAHNCHIHENVWISANALLNGSVRIGKNTTIFSGVIIRDQRTIGENVTIGMGAVVTKNVPDGETWIGNPAKEIIK